MLEEYLRHIEELLSTSPAVRDVEIVQRSVRDGSSARNRGTGGLRYKQGASHTPLGIYQRQSRRTAMDPTTTCCPNLASLVRGADGLL